MVARATFTKLVRKLPWLKNMSGSRVETLAHNDGKKRPNSSLCHVKVDEAETISDTFVADNGMQSGE